MGDIIQAAEQRRFKTSVIERRKIIKQNELLRIKFRKFGMGAKIPYAKQLWRTGYETKPRKFI